MMQQYLAKWFKITETYPIPSLLRGYQVLLIVSVGSLNNSYCSLRRQHVPQTIGAEYEAAVRLNIDWNNLDVGFR